MKKKRIAFFLGSMGRGGAERVISILSKECAKSGMNTDIGLLLYNKVDYEIDPSTRVFNFAGAMSSRIFRIPMWLKKIRKYVKDEKPDVIVSFAARINILVMLACMGLKVKIIVSERNDPKYDGRGVITRCLTNMLYPISDKVIFQTKRVQKQFNSRIQNNSVVIPNPISVAEYASDIKDKKIVSVGRLTEQKNHIMLIKAFAGLLEVCPGYSLYIYGEGELRKQLEQLARDLSIEKNVFLPGNVADIHKRIADAELFVLSSDYEGLSNALLEALMMGVPCVATNCAGSDEFIENAANGLLVPTGDTEVLEKAMIYMIQNKEQALQMGKCARLMSEVYSVDKILDSWKKTIN